MLNPRWLLKAKLWARNPPPLKKVLLVLGVIAIALSIGAIEYLGYWPDWATVDPLKARF